MKTALLIFPHQLFKAHPALESSIDRVVMVEDSLFFGDSQYPLKFHKQKLVLHRASMKQYEAFLSNQGYQVQYEDYQDQNSILNNIFDQFAKDEISTVKICEVVDFVLEKRLKAASEPTGVKIQWLETPMFLNTKEENRSYKAGKKRWFMADFYKWQRQRFGLLMEGDKPMGGQWSFDEENRKKLPKSEIPNIPALPTIEGSPYLEEARQYVESKFPDNYGHLEHFIYPLDFKSAEAWLDDFLAIRFAQFGPYEDAIVPGENYLYHSVLTPMLNIGLLTPSQVIEKVKHHAQHHEVPLPSLEGFIRQIIGWREFMRATYEDLGVTMRTTNAWEHKNPMPQAFYTAATTIDPIDDTIDRVLDTAYCHHIERLMVLGGFMFLCELDPDQIYNWFMEMFIDSYDWVMVPNVYAMSQNADGGHITTKPYFSGSNYIKKMSHYPSGDWMGVWDSLYWSWILRHADELRKNPRWAMMVRMGEKKDKIDQEAYHAKAQRFLQNLS